jgi:hypothetical protein
LLTIVGVEAHLRAAVLVLRAWTEGRPPSLRVRITSTDSALSETHAIRVVTTPDEAADVVRAVLDDLFVGRAADTTEAGR